MRILFLYIQYAIASLLYNDYAGILEYPVSLPLVDWHLVWLCSVYTIDVMIDVRFTCK